jgi:hypothetical protein
MASQLVNFAKMKDMILSVDDETNLRTNNKIKSKSGRGVVSIISQPVEKTYRVLS